MLLPWQQPPPPPPVEPPNDFPGLILCTLLVALLDCPDDERECDRFVAEAERALGRPASPGPDGAAALRLRFVALPPRARAAALYDACARARPRTCARRGRARRARRARRR